MALASCPRCKQLFTKVRVEVCPNCQADEEADFEKIRAFLEESPNKTTDEVAKATGVSRECVMRMVEDGRIQNVAMADPVKCGRCGAPAISLNKKLCQACLDQLNMEVMKAQSKVKLPPRKSAGTASEPNSVHTLIDAKRRT
ncbi:MAG: hypothetical protein HZB26_06950 [Candidatus Hydrogenedentes bacterium]|nr:hypothetical protein [Candidatus Hydrogenedentota bacterium]